MLNGSIEIFFVSTKRLPMLCTYSDMCHIFSLVRFFSMQSDFKWTKSDKQSWILKWQAILKCYSWLHLSPLNKKMKTVLDDVQIAILSLAVKTSLFFHTLLCKISSEWWIISSSKLTPIFNSNEIAIFKQWYGTDLETKKKYNFLFIQILFPFRWWRWKMTFNRLSRVSNNSDWRVASSPNWRS